MRLNNAILWVVILGLFAVPLYAETEIHRQQTDGTVTVEVIRTPQEQLRAETEYDMGNDVKGNFLDGNSLSPKYITKEVYEQQVQENAEKVTSEGQRILNEAGAAHRAGNMSDEEYLAMHSQINVMNGNIKNQVSSIRQSLASAQLIGDTKSMPNRTIKVVPKENQKPRVLVS